MDTREEIKVRLPIEDVVGRYVDLRKAGSNLKGLCPFHQEKTPSFVVSPSRGTFHCFGCQRGGDVFSFVMELEHLQFPEALKQLAEQAGVDMPERQSTRPSLKGRLYEANEVAATFFAELLLASAGERARSYLKHRGFGKSAVDLFGIGYAPAARDLLVQRLKNQGFDDSILLAAGLALQDDVGGALRDRFRGRLMFPIKDRSGRISGFGGRGLEEDQQPKYLNSPQTEIFDKSGVLFGIHLAADPIHTAGRAVLVEGYLDAVRAHLAGYTTIVASLGTAVTTPQLRALRSLAKTVVLALDPDPAGQTAAARTSLTALAELTQDRARQAGAVAVLDLLIAQLPDARDPDELINESPELWEAAIDGAIPAFDFYFEQTMRSLDRGTDGWRQEAIDRLLPPIQQFGMSAGWQATWLQRLSRETDVDLHALERALPAPRVAGSQKSRTTPLAPEKGVVEGTTSRALSTDPAVGIEQALVALLLQVVVVPDNAGELLRSLRLERPEHQTILEALLAWQRNGNYDLDMLVETLPESVRGVARELHARNVPLPEDAKISVAVAFHLARLRRFRLLAELDRVRQLLPELPADERTDATRRLAELMQEMHGLEVALESLSRQTVQSFAAGVD